MSPTIQQFYRIAVQQLPELELHALLQHAVNLYAETLGLPYAYALNLQNEELILAGQLPDSTMLAGAKRFATAQSEGATGQVVGMQIRSFHLCMK